MADDALLRELQRQCDALLATSSASLAAEIAADAQLPPSPGDDALDRLQWTSVTLARRRFLALAQRLLSWTGTPLSCTSRKLAAWLSAHLLSGALEALSSREESRQQLDPAALDAVLTLALDKSFEVLRDVAQQQQALGGTGDSATESSALGFFAFKPMQAARSAPALSADAVLLERAASKWRGVLAWVAKVHSVALVRARLHRELTRWTAMQSGAKTSASQQLPLVKYLADLPLGISSTHSSSTFARSLLGEAPSGVLFTHRLKDAALLLKTVHPLLQKPTKSAVRIEAVALVAAIVKRELLAVDATAAALVYTTAHVSEWNSCLCDLHALAMKCTTKKEFIAVGWKLRVAVLSSLPNDIFGRYWKDDVHALLRLRYQHNKDSASGKLAAATLECIAFCFTQMLQRHFLVDRAVPTELDCMEIINTTQAWCFFSLQKHKSLHKFKEHVLPALVRVSLGIAAYNMAYAVQSHLRRLLMEAESIFDEKKLVGLESLRAIYHHSSGGDRQEREEPASPSLSGAILTFDKKTLEKNSRTLGELVSHILIECNTNLGHELLIDTIGASSASLVGGSGHKNSGAPVAQPSASSTLSSRFLRDDFKRSLAIQTFGATLHSLEFLYDALELSDDQKLLLIARASIHADLHVRECASRALLAIVTSRSKYQAATVFRGLTDFVLRMTGNQASGSDVEACVVLTKLLGSLLQVAIEAFTTESPMCWENQKAKDESLLQVEAACVYLLANDDEILCGCVIDTLVVVRSGCAATDNTVDLGLTAPGSAAHTSMVTGTAQRCVLDVIEAMESELRTQFFSFLPEHKLRHVYGNAQGVPALVVPLFRHLATDTQHPRRSFRWSMCLSMLYERLVHCLPEVTAYIWSDVNDKILKTEPMIPASSGEHETPGDLARWRNLSVLATVSACSGFAGRNTHPVSAASLRDGSFRSEQELQSSTGNSTVQSVISAPAVASLMKRLARYLRSPSITQRKAAILALGSTNAFFLPILIEVLAKYEIEAFGSTTPESASNGETTPAAHCSGGSSIPAVSTAAHGGIWKQSRLSKMKLPARSLGSVQLQWAVGRCYRLLLERLLRLVQQHTYPDGESAHKMPISPANLRPFLLAARGVLDKMNTALEKHGQSLSLDAVVFMMQQDFCVSLRTILQLHREKPPGASAKPPIDATMVQTEHDQPAFDFRSESTVFPSNERERMFYIVMSWCEPIGALASHILAANVDPAGFIPLASPYRKAWMQHCDVFGDRVSEDLVIPSHWYDEDDLSGLVVAASIEAAEGRPKGNSSHLVALLQRYFLCQTAFATMAALAECSSVIFSPPILPDSPVFRWFDECFCVQSETLKGEGAAAESPHFRLLQQICSRTLQVLLVQDFDTFSPICIEKALFTHTHGDKFVSAKHYFGVISDTMASVVNFRQSTNGEGKSGNSGCDGESHPFTAQLLVSFFQIAILHVGAEESEMHRTKALSALKRLLECSAVASNGDALVGALVQQHEMSSSGSKCLPVLLTQTTNRLQIAVSALLAPSFSAHAMRMSSTLLRFIAYCDLPQQRKLFAAVLPWLAEVYLPPSNLNTPSAQSGDSTQLMNILFRLTRNLSSSCSSELEQVWQTLAFTPHTLGSAGDIDGSSPTTNLPAILSFLFFQRGSAIQLATSRTVVWWLSRWHTAAFDCVAGLLEILAAQRRSAFLVPNVNATSTEHQRSESVSDNLTTTNSSSSPLNDIAVILTLLADSSCNLQLAQTQDAAAASDMALQVVHLALLMLFCNLDRAAGDSRAHDPTWTSFFETTDSELFDSIAQDCILVLRNMLPLIQASGVSIEQLINQLSLITEVTQSDTLEKRNRRENEETIECHHRAKLAEFGHALSSFTQASLQPPEVALWSEECVKEFAMAISLFSMSSTTSQQASLLQQPHSVGKAKLQSNLCLRFALRMHRHLAAPFHGDVFLVLTELLHHSLDEQNRDPVSAQGLVRDCLLTLKAMVRLMPASQLVLYPQILWVCVALLNHCKPSGAHYNAVVALLFEILNKPHFFTSAVLQDVLVCKRPHHWSKAQSSILRAIALHMFQVNDDGDDDDVDDKSARGRTLEIAVVATTLPCPILIADRYEHATICTIALMPYLSAGAAGRLDLAQSRQLLRIATDLHNLWSDVDGEEAKGMCDFFDNWDADRSLALGKELRRSFASRLVAFLRRCLDTQPNFDGAGVCIEVLVAAAESGCRESGDKAASESRRRLGSASLLLLQELLVEMESCRLAWRIHPALAASLTRLVREPRNDEQWRVSVVILSYLDTGSSPYTPPNHLPGSSAVAPELTVLTEADSSSVPEAPTTHVKPETPTSIKKETLQTARKFISLMTGRSSSSPSSTSNANASASGSRSNNNSDSNQSHSNSSSSSILTGSHPVIEVSPDPATTATPDVAAHPVEKTGDSNDYDSNPPPPPTPTRRKLFR